MKPEWRGGPSKKTSWRNAFHEASCSETRSIQFKHLWWWKGVPTYSLYPPPTINYMKGRLFCYSIFYFYNFLVNVKVKYLVDHILFPIMHIRSRGLSQFRCVNFSIYMRYREKKKMVPGLWTKYRLFSLIFWELPYILAKDFHVARELSWENSVLKIEFSLLVQSKTSISHIGTIYVNFKILEKSKPFLNIQYHINV